MPNEKFGEYAGERWILVSAEARWYTSWNGKVIEKLKQRNVDSSAYASILEKLICWHTLAKSSRCDSHWVAPFILFTEKGDVRRGHFSYFSSSAHGGRNARPSFLKHHISSPRESRFLLHEQFCRMPILLHSILDTYYLLLAAQGVGTPWWCSWSWPSLLPRPSQLRC